MFRTEFDEREYHQVPELSSELRARLEELGVLSGRMHPDGFIICLSELVMARVRYPTQKPVWVQWTGGEKGKRVKISRQNAAGEVSEVTFDNQDGTSADLTEADKGVLTRARDVFLAVACLAWREESAVDGFLPRKTDMGGSKKFTLEGLE